MTVILLKVTLSKQNAKFEIFFHPSPTIISVNRNIYVKNSYTCIKMYQEIHVIPFLMIFTCNSYTCLLYNYWKYIQGCIPCRNGRSLYHIENHSSSDYYSYGRNLFQKSHQHTLHYCVTCIFFTSNIRIKSLWYVNWDGVSNLGVLYKEINIFLGEIISTWFEVVVESLFIHTFFTVIS